MQEKALGFALNIRKFEIDIYWKRARYFWIFIDLIFAGYFHLVSKVGKINNNSILIVCAVGFVFSYSCYLVNGVPGAKRGNYTLRI
ncbi:hypothetical protein [Clostridium akagii]|uniref:RipA family octameric membrane protein n=1 Tax=Clostridium akagii TaxID=91623 RepID=UPI00047C585D|nr:hypothetical protein [Clostridium akagii]